MGVAARAIEAAVKLRGIMGGAAALDRQTGVGLPAKGPQLAVRLNGTLTAQAEDQKLTVGPIALQYMAGTVRFRRVQIRRL
jgi:hypothetical protein